MQQVQQAMVKFSLTSKQDLKWTYYEDSSFADFEVIGLSVVLIFAFIISSRKLSKEAI